VSEGKAFGLWHWKRLGIDGWQVLGVAGIVLAIATCVLLATHARRILPATGAAVRLVQTVGSAVFSGNDPAAAPSGDPTPAPSPSPQPNFARGVAVNQANPSSTASSHRSGSSHPSSTILVPKLRLGTHVSKLRFDGNELKLRHRFRSSTRSRAS